jgi:hypothetical protein
MNERAHTAETVLNPAHGKRVRLGVIVAVAVLVGFVAWLIFKGDNNKTSSPTRAPAASASYTQLKALPAQVGHDVYWAGTKASYTYELTQTSQGNIYVRYLPAGVDVNDPRPNFLTVGSYPRRDAYTSLKKLATKSSSVSRQLAGGGISVYSKQDPRSVYFAYPSKSVQIEVYDPSASRAQHLVSAGLVRPLP